MREEPVKFFYLGPPKTASTWVFECLKEHPQISATDHSETNYFDIHFHEGEDWYDNLYQKETGVRIDCTPTYINSLQSLERILTYNPDAKFAYGVRNPVDRAFSGYWHVRRTGQINYKFEDILDTYVWFRAWVEPGIISSQIAWLHDRVGKEKCVPVFFDDIKTHKNEIISNLYEYIDIDKSFVPDTKDKKVNVARPKTSLFARATNKFANIVACEKTLKGLSGKKEYLDGMCPKFRRKLNAICMPEIEAMSELTGRDLTGWIK